MNEDIDWHRYIRDLIRYEKHVRNKLKITEKNSDGAVEKSIVSVACDCG